jgi:adenylate kinase
MPLRLLIFGRQGAGKGTQCEYLIEHYGAVHISTGDMLRDAVTEGSEVGVRAKEFMDAGELLPDDLIVGIVRDRLAKPDVQAKGFILDGFPRTVAQAQALWDAAGDSIDLAVNVDVPLDEVKARMLGRGRDDDTDEAIERRLELYEQQTVPAIDWIGSRGTLVDVDGVGTPEQVRDRLIAAIDTATGNSSPGGIATGNSSPGGIATGNSSPGGTATSSAG